MKPLVAFIVGPTACGKSDLAIEALEGLAEPAEILNCDSVQFFEDVDIGSAKPDRQDLKRVPHHLISHVPGGNEYSAGEFRRDALRILDDGAARRIKRWAAVGGSGFYVQALEKGMYPVPDVSEETRAALEREADEDLGKLFEELRLKDPDSALKILPADRYRITRAIGILRSDTQGRTLSGIKRDFESSLTRERPFTVGKFGLKIERDSLRARVAQRTRRMLEAGLIDEVQALRERGLAEWSPLHSVGYREVQDYLNGAITRDALEPAIVMSTMQLAKKQMTWFKRDAEIRWFDAELERKEALHAVREFLLRALTDVQP